MAYDLCIPLSYGPLHRSIKRLTWTNFKTGGLTPAADRPKPNQPPDSRLAAEVIENLDRRYRYVIQQPFEAGSIQCKRPATILTLARVYW